MALLLSAAVASGKGAGAGDLLTLFLSISRACAAADFMPGVSGGGPGVYRRAECGCSSPYVTDWFRSGEPIGGEIGSPRIEIRLGRDLVEFAEDALEGLDRNETALFILLHPREVVVGLE